METCLCSNTFIAITYLNVCVLMCVCVCVSDGRMRQMGSILTENHVTSDEQPPNLASHTPGSYTGKGKHTYTSKYRHAYYIRLKTTRGRCFILMYKEIFLGDDSV